MRALSRNRSVGVLGGGTRLALGVASLTSSRSSIEGGGIGFASQPSLAWRSFSFSLLVYGVVFGAMAVFQSALIRDGVVCVSSHADKREGGHCVVMYFQFGLDKASNAIVGGHVGETLALMEGGSRVPCCDLHPDLRYVIMFSGGFVDEDNGGWDIDNLLAATLAKRCATAGTQTWARAAD